jgi:bacteriocin biosynthesis cyclodehydratase domain-containing protein
MTIHDPIVFSEGRFGAAVAAGLAAELPLRNQGSLVAALPRLQELLRGAGFAAVALWRPYRFALDQLDEACARARVPWSLVVLDRARLQCGPVVSPGRAPCHRCVERRLQAHWRAHDREDALEGALAANDALGIDGFLPGAVGVAVAALRLDAREHAAAAGRMRITDLLHGTCEETRAVGVHGCSRCARTGAAPERYVEHLRRWMESPT